MKTIFVLIAVVLLQGGAAVGQAPAAPVSKEDQGELVRGNNAFAVDLLGQLREQNGNLFFSPASISTALGMAYAGASGDTAAEMRKALHFTLPPERLHPAMGRLLDGLNAQHTGYQLRVADALWGQQTLKFLPSFLSLTKADYAAGFHAVDFATAPENVRQTINQWIEQQTEDKIKDLLPAGSVTGGTRLVLTNAIYFKADWKTLFKKTETKDEDFHVSASASVHVPLMHRQGSFDYLDGGTFQALAIPYTNAEMSMIVLLPKDRDGLGALEKSLTPAVLEEALGKLHFAPQVILTLPKFKTTQEIQLNQALSALGMRQAFESTAADFSAMTGRRDLWISAAIHKAYIDVNEEGTEAAAATGTVMLSMAAPARRPEPIIFRADHPFLYLIRDNQSGGILFMGRLADPTK